MSTTIESKKVLIRIPADLCKVIDRMAKERYQARNTVIIELLRLQINEQIKVEQRPFDGVQKR